jgi:hypothetical protein
LKKILKSIDDLIPAFQEDKCGKGMVRSESNIINNIDLVARLLMPISGDYMFIAEAKNYIKNAEAKYKNYCEENNIQPKEPIKIKGKWIPYTFAATGIAMKYALLYVLIQ